MAGKTSLLARLTMWLGGFAVAAFVLGPFAARAGLVEALTGFIVFALGALLGLFGTILGIVAVIRGPDPSRGAALRGLVPSLFVVIVVLVVAAPSRKYPRINDITTDTTNPPQFVHGKTLSSNVGRDMSYPGESFARQQREGYSDLGPLSLAMSPDEAFARVRSVAYGMRDWMITREDSAARAIEGIDTTSLFRFKDDFIIEVREADGGSVVHMRSKSRDGKGDMGANAKRIRDFFSELTARG